MPKQAINKDKIYKWILGQSPEGGKVLDIGCGDGELLALLAENRGVRGTGIEISEQCVLHAVQRGLSVHHGNVEEGLDHYGDGTFDMVILSLIIQESKNPLEIINESLRVGKKVIIVFPNFGHWSIRRQLAICGRAPQTSSFPYSWYDSPNRHFFTVADWEVFCQEEGWRCLKREFVCGGRIIKLLPNLRAEVAMYLMEKKNNGGK